jgi:hypothetical protein
MKRFVILLTVVIIFSSCSQYFDANIKVSINNQSNYEINIFINGEFLTTIQENTIVNKNIVLEIQNKYDLIQIKAIINGYDPIKKDKYLNNKALFIMINNESITLHSPINIQ